MFRYRPDQGVYARGITFWALTAFAWLAGTRFNYQMQAMADWSNRELTAEAVPVLGFPLTPAFLMGCGLFLVLVVVIWRTINLPKLANLLIDTEQEMKKVTWPSFEDTKNASIVVIGSVVFMLAFLFVADWFLNIVASALIY